MSKKIRHFSHYLWIVLILVLTVISCKKSSDDPQPQPDPAPTAAFSFSPTAPKTGQVVTFTNTSQNADNFSWSSSPAGFTSTDKNPTFTFTAAGTYEITLTAKKGSKSATSKQSITVTSATTTPVPVADFSFAPATPKTGDRVQFTNTSQNATTYEWSSSPAGFTSTDKDPSFTFTQAGTFQVTLKATGAGGTHSTTKAVTIAAPPAPAPVAAFSFSPASPRAGEKVQFTNTSQNATTYEWSSSPAGFTSTAKDPSFTFSQAGTFQVTLKATGAGGTNTVTQSVSVAQAASADPCTGCYVTKSVLTTFGIASTVAFEYSTIGGKKVPVKIFTSNASGTIVTEISYDAQVRRLRDNNLRDGVLQNYTTYEYSGSNTKPSRTNSYSASGTLTAYNLYTYNSSNLLTRDDGYEASGTLKSYNTYENFTAEGFPRVIKSYNAPATLTSTSTYTFQACNPTRIITTDGSGAQIADIVNTIDARGLLRRSNMTTTAQGFTVTSVTDYTYDCD